MSSLKNRSYVVTRPQLVQFGWNLHAKWYDNGGGSKTQNDFWSKFGRVTWSVNGSDRWPHIWNSWPQVDRPYGRRPRHFYCLLLNSPFLLTCIASSSLKHSVTTVCTCQRVIMSSFKRQMRSYASVSTQMSAVTVNVNGRSAGVDCSIFWLRRLQSSSHRMLFLIQWQRGSRQS